MKIGDRAKVAENKGKPIYRKIESSSTLKRVNKERGSGKSFNAIYRTKGKKYLKPAKNLIKQVAGGKTIAGHIERVNDNGFIVGTGFPAAKELHKDRKLMGVTKTDMKIINEILEQGYIDRVLKNR